VRRRGVAINSVTAQYRPRPQSNHYIRQVTFGFSFNDYYSKLQHETESRNYSYNPFGLLLHGGERFSYTINQNYERLFQPFHIHEGIAIPVGQYSFVRHVLATSGPTNKVLSYSVSYDRGGFYSGSSDELVSSLTWKKSASLTTSFEFRKYWVRLLEGSFNTSLALYRFNYYFTPNISLTNFVQYDTDSQNIGLQSRLRWILKAGQEFYVVFNHQWQEDAFDRFQVLTSDFRAKINYTIRF
jgi:hypothetical protein